MEIDALLQVMRETNLAQVRLMLTELQKNRPELYKAITDLWLYARTK